MKTGSSNPGTRTRSALVVMALSSAVGLEGASADANERVAATGSNVPWMPVVPGMLEPGLTSPESTGYRPTHVHSTRRWTWPMVPQTPRGDADRGGLDRRGDGGC